MKLTIDGVTDAKARENFQKLDEEFRLKQLLNGEWRFIETQTALYASTLTINHNLPFTPTDIIQLSAQGDQNFYWIYNNFSDTTISVYVNGPVILRYLVGRAKA